MTINLPEDVREACGPLFESIPYEASMGRLVGEDPKQTSLVEKILQLPVLQNRPELAAGLWLYVDNLDRSHRISQSLDDETGAFWHGIMHRREGDFGNSHYWMRRAAGHPLAQSLDPDSLVDAVADAKRLDEPALVQRQRDEWRALFEWCARDRS